MRNQKTKDMILSAMFVALISVGAFIKIPIPVVPFTLQDLFTMLAGLLLGKRRGSLAVCVYVALGLMGLPVFAKLWLHHWICRRSLCDRGHCWPSKQTRLWTASLCQFCRAWDRVSFWHGVLLSDQQFLSEHSFGDLAPVFVLLSVGGSR